MKTQQRLDLPPAAPPPERTRYLLTREVQQGGLPLLWVCLNPSTAEGLPGGKDDPTVRKLRGFTKRAGHSELRLVNLYPLRATKPLDLWRAQITSEERRLNINALLVEAQAAAAASYPAVLAWGGIGHASSKKRPAILAHMRHVVELLRAAEVRLLYLGLTQDNMPRHPLMLGYDTPLLPVPEDWRIF